MTMPAEGSHPRVHPPRRYVRPVVAVHFPGSEEVPETHRHLVLRTTLYLTVERTVGDRATVGSDQFVYWDPTDAGQRCAPDVMVRLGIVKRGFDSWKVWEDGAPDLAVEIVSKSDSGAAAWQQKIDRYRKIGVHELVRFDADDATRPLRIWDGVDGDLVERDQTDPSFARCDVLDAYWQTPDDARGGVQLRLSADAEGRDLWLTPGEAEQREADGRQRAEARNRELEAENEKLRRR